MRTYRTGFLRAAMLVLALSLASAAHAAPVTFEFEAVIRGIYDTNDASVPVRADIVDDLTSLGVVVGAPVQGVFRYDDGGTFDPASVEFAFSAGILSARTPPGLGVLSAYVLMGGNELVQLGGGLDLGAAAAWLVTLVALGLAAPRLRRGGSCSGGTAAARRAVVAALSLSSICAVAGTADAAPITWRIEGIVREVDVPVSSVAEQLSSLGVAAGSPFTARLVFESDTVDTVPADPTFGFYSGAVSVLEVTIGTYQAAVATSAERNVVVNATFGAIMATGYGGGSLLTTPTLNLELYREPLFTGFENDALPTSPPDLADLTPYAFPTYNTMFQIQGWDGMIFGELTELVQVPEPGAGWLAGGALLALALAHRLSV